MSVEIAKMLRELAFRTGVEPRLVGVAAVKEKENYCNSTELRGMDSTLPHLENSRERLLDV